MRNKILKYTLVFIAFFMLAGCVKTYYQQVNIIRMNNYYAQLFAERLEKFGVTVIQDKEKVVIILPSKIFKASSANFAVIAPRLLDEVSNLLRYYEMEVVRVVGVMPDKCCGEDAKALAMARADKVTKYFWAQAVNVSLAYAEGQLRSEIKENMPGEYVAISFRKI